MRATVRHPGKARYWLRQPDAPAAPTIVGELTKGFSDVGPILLRRRPYQAANDSADVLSLTT